MCEASESRALRGPAKVTVKQWSEKCQALEVAKPKASASWDFLIFSLGRKNHDLSWLEKRGSLVELGGYIGDEQLSQVYRDYIFHKPS